MLQEGFRKCQLRSTCPSPGLGCCHHFLTGDRKWWTQTRSPGKCKMSWAGAAGTREWASTQREGSRGAERVDQNFQHYTAHYGFNNIRQHHTLLIEFGIEVISQHIVLLWNLSLNSPFANLLTNEGVCCSRWSNLHSQLHNTGLKIVTRNVIAQIQGVYL